MNIGGAYGADDEFDPIELAAISDSLDRIFANEQEGYEMIFWINGNDAQELVTSYAEASRGDPLAISRCFYEFGKIVHQIEAAIREEDR